MSLWNFIFTTVGVLPDQENFQHNPLSNRLMLGYQSTTKFGLDEINEIRASENPLNLPWNHRSETNETYTQIHFFRNLYHWKTIHFGSLRDFSSRNHDSRDQISSIPVRFDERRGIICRMLEFIFAEAWPKFNVVVNYHNSFELFRVFTWV